MSFRKALLSDLDQLDELFLTNSAKRGGYLLCESSKPNRDNLGNVFVVDDGRTIIAYVSYCMGMHQDMLNSELTAPVEFEAENFIYIKQVAVKKELQNAGVGTYLYKQLFKYYPEHTFYCHVSIKNPGSIALHKKTGFDTIGIYRKDNFNEADNYQSYFLRRLALMSMSEKGA